ncbi:hypothetical protein [Actinomadura mexicana]|nr:hypothetical protein [Actinomadura mexicana]
MAPPVLEFQAAAFVLSGVEVLRRVRAAPAMIVRDALPLVAYVRSLI